MSKLQGAGKRSEEWEGARSSGSDSEGDEGPPESSEHRNDRISRRF